MKKKKEEMTKEEKFLKSWLVQKLRRISYQWPARKAAKKAARVSRGKYECAMCKDAGVEKLYGPKEIVLDHIEPVISVEEGFIDWNNYIVRLFCEESGFQVLCKSCHDIKTYLENDIRKQIRMDKINEEDDI